MHSNQRIKRKIPFLSKKPDPKKEDMLDITPISLKRHEMKLPLITSKMTPKRDISIEFKPSLKKNTPVHMQNTPSPNHYKSNKLKHSDQSYDIFKKKNIQPRIKHSSLISKLQNPDLSSKVPQTNRGSIRAGSKFIETFKKFTLDFIHSSSSEISSEEHKEEAKKEEGKKEEAKKFESPAV